MSHPPKTGCEIASAYVMQKLNIAENQCGVSRSIINNNKSRNAKYRDIHPINILMHNVLFLAVSVVGQFIGLESKKQCLETILS